MLTPFSERDLTYRLIGGAMGLGKLGRQSRNGNVSGKHVEFWDVIPDFGFRSKLEIGQKSRW